MNNTIPPTTPEGNDSAWATLAQLRAEFPDWSFGIAWQAANSGPDARVMYATMGCLVVSDQTAAGLASKLRDREVS